MRDLERKRGPSRVLGGVVIKQYFEALFAEDYIGICVAIQLLSKADRLRVYLSCGIGGPNQYGFGAEVGRA